MTIETAIKAKTDTDIATVGNRVYAIESPKNPVKPYIVYKRINEKPVSLIGSDTDIIEARFQFNAYADTFEASVALGNEIKNAWKRFNGVQSSVIILDCMHESTVDGYDDAIESNVRSVDIMITFRE